MTLSIVFNKRPVIEPLQSAIINFFHCPSARCQPEPVLGSFVRFLVIFPVYMPARERVKSLKKKSDRVFKLESNIMVAGRIIIKFEKLSSNNVLIQFENLYSNHVFVNLTLLDLLLNLIKNIIFYLPIFF